MGIFSGLVARIKMALAAWSLKRSVAKLERMHQEEIKNAMQKTYEEEFQKEKEALEHKLLLQKAKHDAEIKVFGGSKHPWLQRLQERREHVRATRRSRPQIITRENKPMLQLKRIDPEVRYKEINEKMDRIGKLLG